MANEVDYTYKWNLDYDQIPGCRLNSHGLRFFSVHPDLQDTYVLSQPNSCGALLLKGVKFDLTTVINDHPGEKKAVTRPLFVRRVKL